ncbi:MAG: hypothetical protein LBD23_19615, partial [Oscillospiraceae bacterium]|nr:hypothetical protein [Oscillospiraceae bacterium]
PSLSVLDFCTASRERFEERKKRDKKKNVIDDYRKIHYEDLRKMVLNGEVEHKYMTEAKYEYLYDNETSHSSEVDINNQNSSEFIDHYLILDFCTNGLRRFDKYKGLADFEIFTRFMTARVERENAERDVLRSFYKNPIRKNKLAMVFLAPIAFLLTVFRQPKLAMQTMINLFSLFYKRHKAVAVAAIAVITSVFLITVSSALGYSFIELIRSAFSSSEKFATDNDGNEIILADTRFYNSIDEMLEAEKLSILFPVNLPHGYNFTDFEITDFNTDLELRIYATNPYIMFIVRIGANNQIESYSYEANGIKYNIVKMDDGLYQAEWNNNEDYYTIAVSDKAILSEIIKNLKEN